MPPDVPVKFDKATAQLFTFQMPPKKKNTKRPYTEPIKRIKPSWIPRMCPWQSAGRVATMQRVGKPWEDLERLKPFGMK